ncbi:MAG: single-stranded DNA-binding protein [Clostridiaceae bacterium]
MENNRTNNNMHLEGKIISDLEFSHELYSEKFYTFDLSVARLSGKDDTIKITLSEKLLGEFTFKKGAKLQVLAQLRSYNKYSGGKNKLVLTAFARSCSNIIEFADDPNIVILEGHICRVPTFRTTPLGREIADLLIAVNRNFNKSDYIPVICWGRNARYAKSFNVGDKVLIEGRFQSRIYEKQIDENEKINLIAYEVSVSNLAKPAVSSEDTDINEEVDGSHKKSQDTVSS